MPTLQGEVKQGFDPPPTQHEKVPQLVRRTVLTYTARYVKLHTAPSQQREEGSAFLPALSSTTSTWTLGSGWISTYTGHERQHKVKIKANTYHPCSWS